MSWSNSASLIRWRGLAPLARRRASEYGRSQARCFSAQVGQRVCPCMAGWLHRQIPCSLRSWRVRAGFLDFDGRCLAEGDLARRRGEGFDPLDLGLLLALGFRFGMNTVSTNSCGLVLFIPACAGGPFGFDSVYSAAAYLCVVGLMRSIPNYYVGGCCGSSPLI